MRVESEHFDLMRRELEFRYDPDGTRKFINILLLFTRYPEGDVMRAVGLCVSRRAFNDEAVLGVLRNEPIRPTTRLILSNRPELLGRPRKSWLSGAKMKGVMFPWTVRSRPTR